MELNEKLAKAFGGGLGKEHDNIYFSLSLATNNIWIVWGGDAITTAPQNHF